MAMEMGVLVCFGPGYDQRVHLHRLDHAGAVVHTDTMIAIEGGFCLQHVCCNHLSSVNLPAACRNCAVIAFL